MFFFTLSATNTKWSDLHALIATQCLGGSDQLNKQNIHNIISNPHITPQYMHNRFKIFLEEVLQKWLNTIYFWCMSIITHTCYPSFHVHHFKIFLSNILFFSCRFEWKHRGSTHINCFIWLEYAPNMDILDSGDVVMLEVAKHYFGNFFTACNPRAIHLRTPWFQHCAINDPCSLRSTSIFAANHLDEYK